MLSTIVPVGTDNGWNQIIAEDRVISQDASYGIRMPTFGFTEWSIATLLPYSLAYRIISVAAPQVLGINPPHCPDMLRYQPDCYLSVVIADPAQPRSTRTDTLRRDVICWSALGRIHMRRRLSVNHSPPARSALRSPTPQAVHFKPFRYHITMSSVARQHDIFQ